MQYRLVEWKVKGKPEAVQDEEFNKLHVAHAPTVLALIHELRGFYVKLGQIGSTRADFVPEEYLKRFETLQVRA